jgi:hypothetical protein
VARDDVGERTPQRRDVERPAHPERVGDVVFGGARFELVEEPQSLLGKRQRQHAVAPQPGDAGDLAVIGKPAEPLFQ